MGITNRIGEIRRKRGMAVTALADAVGVTRQTIYSIEDGDFVPNTAVALRLARVLDVTVEELFRDGETTAKAEADHMQAELLMPAGQTPQRGQLVQACRVGDRVVAIPATETPDFLPEGNAVLEHCNGKRARIRTNAADENRVLIAGCDPALSLLSAALLNCASLRSLQLLKHGSVHIAGCHVRDPETGEYNAAAIRSMFRKGEVQVFTFAAWEQGLIVQRGNPKAIRTAEDLAMKSKRLVCRETGSGSRDLLETELRRVGADVETVLSRSTVAYSHLSAARAVHAGTADCAVGSRAAAQFYRLDFITLRQDRFDLVVPKRMLSTAGVKAVIDELSTLRFRRRLQLLAGYETSSTGNVVM